MVQETKEEIVRGIKEACPAEDIFPGVLGNPVTYAARWGLPLSKSYLAYLDKQRKAVKPSKGQRKRRKN
jgi:hypothetical protein